jgi:hypothetical protein
MKKKSKDRITQKPHHTLEQCWWRKADENLKDKVNSDNELTENLRSSPRPLAEEGNFTTDQRRMMKSILRTPQDITMGDIQ